MAPVVVGIAGGSGSGKTTVVRRLVDQLGAANASVIEHDRYYRHHPTLTFDARARLNFDHPDALETDLLVAHLRQLRAGQPIEAPVYDFARHLRLPHSETIFPRPVILLDGILLLVDPTLRDLLDIKVFVETDDDARFARRRERDTRERGRTIESVIEQYRTTVQPMHREFVEPSKRHADVIIAEGGHNVEAIEGLLAKIRGVGGRGFSPAGSGRKTR